ncbi:MAG TPA: CPBP family intramembrane glutamic endopeptidase [Blastocatellia bacterium]|nr:CPBP family intramembrane glutamic endopeptidase [Blastocatellia bacterium]
MRVLKEIQPVEEQAARISAPQPAQLSLRAVTALEVVSVVMTVLITAWVIMPLRLGSRWLESLPGLLALMMMINSHRVRGETPRELGFTARHFGRAVGLLIGPMITVVMIALALGYSLRSLHFTSHFLVSFAGRSVWGLLQQYVLQAFIYRRLKSVLVAESASETGRVTRTRLAIVIAALLFALVHAPNLPLMALTLVSALLWTWVYDRAPNLLALGLSHGLLSAVTAASLPDWVIKGMTIGVRHLVYQAF